MSLPTLELDDRRFQDLVTEARIRIARACPEWTEHNVSDPGVTLIELFAWMTEMTIYRLNRVPDKLHMTLLELLGIRLGGPSAAETRLRFGVAEDRGEPVRIPSGTQVSTAPQLGGEPLVFTTEEDVVVPVLGIRSVGIHSEGRAGEVTDRSGVLGLDGHGVQMFGTPPADGECLMIGFEESLGGLTLMVRVEAEPGRGVGVDPENPPLVWEVSQGDGRWEQAAVLSDGTGGFNYGSGDVELQAPRTSHVLPWGGRRLHWLRCRLDTGTGPTFETSPRLQAIDVTATGAEVRAVHAGRYDDEPLGLSDGTPGQQFPLRHRPVLRLEPGDALAVRDPDTGAESLWEPRESFEESTEFDLHFRVEPVSGTVELGPAIRQTDGTWSQYGAIPPKGAALRFTHYRAGGGGAGNVAASTLTALVDPVEGVVSVTNPAPAVGGIDAETLESARMRASRQIRTRSRAVTAEDFEYLAREASPRVARAVCVPPVDGGAVALHLLPQAAPADRRLTYDELVPDARLLQDVAEYLDERRLIGTVVHLQQCRFRGLSVVVNLQVHPMADPLRVEEDVAYALYRYLNPLIGGPHGDGWPFGRPLNIGILYGIVHEVAGVDFVKILRTYETNLQTGEQAAHPSGTHIVLDPDELVVSGTHIVKATAPEV